MEVLEEEELRVMRSQQQHYNDLHKTEMSDSQRMELMEQRKLQEFERRKALERDRKKNKIQAHRKICSRLLSKGYMSGLKNSAVQYLTDVGYFTNTFQVDVLEQNVLPWLFNRVEGFVSELDQLNSFPDVFLGANVDEFLRDHQETVQLEKDRKESVRQAIDEALREKQEDKKRKREAKDAARKAADLKKLREQVDSQFVSKGEYKESILLNEASEINGNLSKSSTVGILGGFLGQLVMVVSGAHRKAKHDGIKVLLDPKVVQNFLHLYIETRMKTDKFTLQVGHAVQQFLLTLEKPLQLNEMRVMKDANYNRFRQILSDLTLYGDEFLALLREQNKSLGLSKKAYDLVYEGFWDLYCKRPVSLTDIPLKKLEGFLQRVKLVVPPLEVTEEDGSVTKSPASLPLKAVVRIRIPLIRPVHQIENSKDEDDEDEGDNSRQGTQRSKIDTGRSGAHGDHQQLSTHPDEDISQFTEQQIEDRVFLVNPISENGRIWVMHQAAARLLRKDMILVLKKSIKELENIENDDFIASVEAHSVDIEKNFIKMFSSDDTNKYDAIRSRFFTGGSSAPIPTFDFELN